MNPVELLESVQAEVQTLLDKQDVTKLAEYFAGFESPVVAESKFTPETIGACLATIVKNIPSSKYIFSIVLTACLKKLIDPKQDIRIAQDNMQGGYSNRSLDQRIVTPFLKRYGYTHCEASGLESGRNLERPSPWDLSYQAKPRGLGNRESFLCVLDFVQNKSGDSKKVITYLLYLDAITKTVAESIESAPLEEDVAKIELVFARHFSESSGQGKSRLPVLALYAFYQQAVGELARYQNISLQPLERHTTADLRSGSIGDIQFNSAGQPFEGIEVKSEKPITPDMVNELLRKFNGVPVNRYYVLTTYQGVFKPEDKGMIESSAANVTKATGCQVIIGSILDSLHYYLQLLDKPEQILSNYVLLLESDPDIRPELITKWNEILADIYK